MGRGQMSSFDMTDAEVSISGKEYWITNKRKFVTSLAISLPLLVTCFYMYSITPDAAAESIVLFQDDVVPYTESSNTTIFDSSSTGNGLTSEGIGNTTDSLDVQGSSNTTTFDSSSSGDDLTYESIGNTTDSLDIQESSNTTTFDSSPNGNDSTYEVIGNTTDSLDVQGSSNTSTFGSDVNEYDAEVEPTADSTGNTTDAQPLVEPSAAVGSTVNETIHNPELRNLTTSDPLNNVASPNQTIPDGNQQTVIATEGSGLSNVTNARSKGDCDLLKGSWVADNREPQYTNATCYHIQETQNCMKNGRPDSGYLYWKWQPEQCDLLRIDHRAFLAAMRDRHMAFVGDSIARNQFQSLLCLLSQSEQPENIYAAPDDRDKVFVFRSYNFTIAVYWSPYLVHVEDKQITLPNNQTAVVPDVHLDKLDEAFVSRIPGVDFLQISTGQWWFKFAYYFQNGQTIGCHTYPGMPECEDIGYVNAYSQALSTVMRGVFSIPGYSGTTIFRSLAPDHFEGGSWNTEGKCLRTGPGGVAMSYTTKSMYDAQFEVFQNVTAALDASEKQRLRMLDITKLAQERPDAHPDAYRNPHPFDANNASKQQRVVRDCLHWCLPGPIDTWNDLLVQSLSNCL